MDTEKQQWFCDICKKKYSLKRKEKHLLTKVHENNRKCMPPTEEELEEYLLRRDVLLSEGIADLDFLGFLKKRVLVDKQLKEEFGRNYEVPE